MFNLFSPAKTNPNQTKVVDPVCNMKINQGSAVAEYQGKTYFFCSDSCKQQFDADPEQYL